MLNNCPVLRIVKHPRWALKWFVGRPPRWSLRGQCRVCLERLKDRNHI